MWMDLESIKQGEGSQKESASVGHSVVSNSCNPMGCSPPGSSDYRSGLLFPSPGALPNLGIKPGSPTSQADTLPSESPWKPKSEREEQRSYINAYMWNLEKWYSLTL